jgi:hypothetical protein
MKRPLKRRQEVKNRARGKSRVRGLVPPSARDEEGPISRRKKRRRKVTRRPSCHVGFVVGSAKKKRRTRRSKRKRQSWRSPRGLRRWFCQEEELIVTLIARDLHRHLKEEEEKEEGHSPAVVGSAKKKRRKRRSIRKRQSWRSPRGLRRWFCQEEEELIVTLIARGAVFNLYARGTFHFSHKHIFKEVPALLSWSAIPKRIFFIIRALLVEKEGDGSFSKVWMKNNSSNSNNTYFPWRHYSLMILTEAKRGSQDKQTNKQTNKQTGESKQNKTKRNKTKQNKQSDRPNPGQRGGE